MQPAPPPALPVMDLGHRGDFDEPALARMVRKSPTERLRHHEGWRALLTRRRTVNVFTEEIVKRLAAEQVEYLIVGGVSAVLLGATITTRDLDICYRRTPENAARLARALAPLAPRPRGFPDGLPFPFDATTIVNGCNFTLTLGDEDVDLLGEMSAVGNYEQVIATAEEIDLAGIRVKLLSLEHLIATKTAANRPKDLAVLPELHRLLQWRHQASRDPDGVNNPET